MLGKKTFLNGPVLAQTCNLKSVLSTLTSQPCHSMIGIVKDSWQYKVHQNFESITYQETRCFLFRNITFFKKSFCSNFHHDCIYVRFHWYFTLYYIWIYEMVIHNKNKFSDGIFRKCQTYLQEFRAGDLCLITRESQCSLGTFINTKFIRDCRRTHKSRGVLCCENCCNLSM